MTLLAPLVTMLGGGWPTFLGHYADTLQAADA
jgi:hypothetical protein